MTYIPPKKRQIKTTYSKKTESQFDWWNADKDIWHHAIACSNQIQTNQLSLRSLWDTWNKVYENRQEIANNPRAYAANNANLKSGSHITLNVIKSCVDTVHSKIAKVKPGVEFITNDADHETRARAVLLTEYVKGVFYEAKIYDHAQEAFKESIVAGTGCIHTKIESYKIVYERVPLSELSIDEEEAAYGHLRQIHRTKPIDRSWLKKKYPDAADKIDAAGQDESKESVVPTIQVIESWHLPYDENSKDGKHIVSIDGYALLEEEYTKNYLPFDFLRWNKRNRGFYGIGIAEELIGIQKQINRMLNDIGFSIQNVARPRIFVENGANVQMGSINNQIGQVLRYTGMTPPIFSTPAAMSGDVYAFLENLYNKAFQITGISLLSATSQKPAGINSSVAMETYQDIESERFAVINQNYNQLFVEIAKKTVDMSRDLFEQNKKLVVKSASSKFMGKIKWKDCNLDEDMFRLRAQQVSALPDDAAGRLQMITDLAAKGLIPNAWLMEELDDPDFADWKATQTAGLKEARGTISNMLQTGEYDPPTKYQDLNEHMVASKTAYLNGKDTKSLTVAQQNLLCRYMDEVAAVLNPPAPPAPPMDPNAPPPMPPNPTLPPPPQG